MPSETIHNPDRFIGDLRQILGQGRKRIGFLAGAGAPVSVRVNKTTGTLDASGQPLIPAVAGLTANVISALVGTHAAAAKSIQIELGSAANIETILSRVRLLERALGTTVVNGLDGTGYHELGDFICREIGEIVKARLPDGRTPFTELISWIGGAPRSHAVEIFTTNYDLLFEEAFERARVPYFDGFSGAHRPFFDPVAVASDELPPRWARVWKLHGSLGWSNDGANVVRLSERSATNLIYPDHLKYDLTQKQPYTALFARLKSFLMKPDTVLLTSGFSFGDAHVCAVLEEALAVNPSAAVFAFQYSSLSDAQPACSLASNRPNMSVYAADGAVIRGVPGPWRPGEPPSKDWQHIRSTFWAKRNGAGPDVFILGDFAELARFCALSLASELTSSPATSGASGAAGSTATASAGATLTKAA